MSNKITTEEFIKRSTNIHKGKYDYSQSIYIDALSNIKIICPIHGKFEQNSYRHLQGQGCKKCRNEFYRKKYLFTKEKWISLCNKKHNNKFDYSLVEYVGGNKEVKIICPVHNIFKQKAKIHSRGFGCKQCQIDSQKLTKEEFIKRSTNIHKGKYDYSNVVYINNHTKIKILCNQHGLFEQTPANHLNGQRCPVCKSSRGENKIQLFLEQNNIDFKKEFRIFDCRDKKPLPFDFAVFIKNSLFCLIEYDGEHHFIPRCYGSKVLKETQKRDIIKNNFCLKNKIKLIRISYKNFNLIDNILYQELIKQRRIKHELCKSSKDNFRLVRNENQGI